MANGIRKSGDRTPLVENLLGERGGGNPDAIDDYQVRRALHLANEREYRGRLAVKTCSRDFRQTSRRSVVYAEILLRERNRVLTLGGNGNSYSAYFEACRLARCRRVAASNLNSTATA